MAATEPVLIAGGGIGGLALALALARRGVASKVLERRASFSAEGAGIQLGPNATRILTRLGVAEALAAAAGNPQSIQVFNGISGARLAELPLGPWLVARHGAPYWVLHRADLQSALLTPAHNSPLIEIITGYAVSAFSVEGAGVRVTAGTQSFNGRLLVGADGLRSRVRTLLWPDARLTYSGKTASRTLIAAAEAPQLFRQSIVGVWMAPRAHVVHYPVSQGREIAVIAIVAEDWPGDGWTLDVPREGLAERLRMLPRELRSFLDLATEWRRWALYDASPLPRLARGPVILMGDAAHPILPFLAQGGALAIEDAETLADCIAGCSDLRDAGRRYEGARGSRAAHVQQASRRNGAIYHLSPPASLARDLTLRAAPGSALMALYDWVYGWRGDVPPDV